MRTEVERTEDVEGDFRIEAKASETNGSDFIAVFIEGTNLEKGEWLASCFAASGMCVWERGRLLRGQPHSPDLLRVWPLEEFCVRGRSREGVWRWEWF